MFGGSECIHANRRNIILAIVTSVKQVVLNIFWIHLNGSHLNEDMQQISDKNLGDCNETKCQWCSFEFIIYYIFIIISLLKYVHVSNVYCVLYLILILVFHSKLLTGGNNSQMLESLLYLPIRFASIPSNRSKCHILHDSNGTHKIGFTRYYLLAGNERARIL